MEVQKHIIWKVHCPKDGPQLLRHTGLHVYIRAGLAQHVVTYFCPECGQQRYQLVEKNVSRSLIQDLKVAFSVLHVPLEALEPHYGAPITQRWIDDSIQGMERPDWEAPQE